MNASMTLAQVAEEIKSLLRHKDSTGAERRARTYLQTHPPHPEILRLLGVAQLQSQQADAALNSMQRALTLAPDSVDILCNIATIETQRGNTSAALEVMERALQRAPTHPALLNNLGRLRHDLGDYAEACTYFERCLEVQPNYAGAWFNFATTKFAQWDLASTERFLQNALRLDPNLAEAWYLLGYVLKRAERLNEAAAAFRTSLSLRDSAKAAHELALVLERSGDCQGAASLFQHALDIEPDRPRSIADLVQIKRKLCDWTDLPELSARLRDAIRAQAPDIIPFPVLLDSPSPADQLQCARTFSRKFAPAVNIPPRDFSALPTAADAPIRVGFVSSGFVLHPTALLIAELIEALRNTPLTTVAFSSTPNDRSKEFQRLADAFGEFHDISGRAPESMADFARAKHCDVVIDLDGYCSGAVPQAFAARMAPVQINWLAYPGSLGAPWYDYLIADRFVIPDELRSFYDENIAWLPRCYQPMDCHRQIISKKLRGDHGLPEAGFVYCCFNHSAKISMGTFAMWMQILGEVQGSVLWLLDSPRGIGIPERLRRAAADAGVDPARLIFAARHEHAEYLGLYRHADLFLDTYPCNAHTTASDALYAGCPVLTRPGETFASRVAGSLNHQLGLDELNASNDADYVATAINLGVQKERSARLRLSLADSRRRSRLFDMQSYARDFSFLLERIVARARRGEAPGDILGGESPAATTQ